MNNDHVRPHQGRPSLSTSLSVSRALPFETLLNALNDASSMSSSILVFIRENRWDQGCTWLATNRESQFLFSSSIPKTFRGKFPIYLVLLNASKAGT
jgi:hypothetical protein